MDVCGCGEGDTHTRLVKSPIAPLRVLLSPPLPSWLEVTERARLAVVSLAQSRKCAGDKAAMWQDVMGF